MKDGAPLLFGLQVDIVFGVKEASGVGAIVGASDLAGALRNLRKRAENNAGLIGDANAFVGAGAGSESAANPERAFIEVGKEFGANGAAEGQVVCDRDTDQADSDGDGAMANRPANGFA